ncbi:hypothetical protein [Desulfitibacter alkalitolerans]|uniref:hypothetical protein n=1 Tax=Desulfitibacter alkalitolerans TaxID=264641 RepID=UPI000687B7F1|nr:hypothetical protein [Desulfitibacter alkalitolerans]
MKTTFYTLIKIFLSLVIGLGLTQFILKPIYEVLGIAFYGNLWVLWFAMAYFIYTLINLFLSIRVGAVKSKETLLFSINWLLLILAFLIIIFPILKREIPY